MRKFVVEINPQNCGHVFEDWGTVTKEDKLLFQRPQDVALVVFTGGSDVWPELYGEKSVHRWTSFWKERDLYEAKMFEQSQKHNIPCVGICRGSQFLCVMSGGKLIQDVTNHGGYHNLKTNEGETISCNSTHHQMQLPPKDAKVLAWAEPRLSKHYQNGDGEDVDVDYEYEVVYYPRTNSLGCQYHPEWLRKNDPCVIYAQDMAKKYLKVRKNG